MKPGGALSLEAALARFAERLERARAAARTEPTGLARRHPGSTPSRHAQGLWITAARLFMEDVGLGRFTDLPLTMIESLGNLDRGIVREPLDPADTDETRVAIQDSRTMARAAKVLDLLSAPGPARLTREEAAKMIFARLPDLSPFASSGAIIDLRKRIQKGTAPRDVLALWKMPLPAEAGQTAAERAAWLLGMLSER